jgi:enoyl-CoA hydratase/carnithine racemase
LLAETLAVARTIAAAPIEAIMAGKRLLLATRHADVVAARQREDAAFVELLGTAANLAALERFGTSAGP